VTSIACLSPEARPNAAPIVTGHAPARDQYTAGVGLFKEL
jgi:hypothetical protein